MTIRTTTRTPNRTETRTETEATTMTTSPLYQPLPLSLPTPPDGVGSWAARRAVMTPRAVALRQQSGTGWHDVTYADLHALVERTASGLLARGVHPGDRVAWWGANSIEMVVALLAIARVGAISVPLNTRLAEAETAAVLERCEPALLLHVGPAPVAPSRGAQALEAIEALEVDEGRGGAGLAVLWDDALPPAPVHRSHPDDLLMIQFTSGTSGQPKGVCLTHGNVLWNCVNLLLDVDVISREIALVTAPLFHTAALDQVLLPVLLKGGTAIIEPRFDPARVLALIESERVTMLFGVTSMYQALAAEPAWDSADLSSLRSALSGGSPLPEVLLRTWADRGLPVLQGYGLTEASPGVTMLRAADAVERLGSAGTPCLLTDVRVVDAAGRDLEGEPGEVWVRGPHVSPGYWRDPAATSAAFVDGWLRTGDVAVREPDGHLRITGRLKDMFISGGENVYPAEVEAACLTHPDVLACAVIGVPDPQWGEVGCAVLVLRPEAHLDLTGLRAHLEGRLARYKMPRLLEVVDALPLTASGKLAKEQVRRLVAAR
ncbi:long-chain fatty acid--CoA ligase [Nocardioides fonticola]|uniref:Long-chain fatty acid--CoA ligase n=1 Tax=Nocardioides fonticola TaxID=450363 RepID=A0ABP7XW46_9ACTN